MSGALLMAPTVAAASERAREAIVFHATDCERSLRCAVFADDNPTHYSAGTGEGLRRLAAYASDRAFEWADALARLECAS